MESPPGDTASRMVVLGRVAGVFGVSGWVKVFSHTSPPENILNYDPWYLKSAGGWRECRLLNGRRQGKGLVAGMEGCTDRDQAAALIGSDIAVPRASLETLGQDEYYWTDLQGLEVINLEGRSLGRVSHLFSTGANDVLVLKGERERLVPFVWEQVVKSVDLDGGRMQVDWDTDF